MATFKSASGQTVALKTEAKKAPAGKVATTAVKKNKKKSQKKRGIVHKMHGYLGDLQGAVMKGVAEHDKLVQRIRGLENEKAPVSKTDSKYEFTVVTVPDQKDVALLKQAATFMRGELRSLIGNQHFTIWLNDGPTAVVSTAGLLLGATCYWNDFTTAPNFSSWQAVFDTMRLDAVTTRFSGCGITAGVVTANASAIYGATDVDQTGTSSFTTGVPSIGTVMKYPLHGTGNRLFEPVITGPNAGTWASWTTTMAEIPRGIDGNSATVTKVPMGVWINATGSPLPVTVVGAHLFSSEFNTYVASSNMGFVTRSYKVSFANPRD